MIVRRRSKSPNDDRKTAADHSARSAAARQRLGREPPLPAWARSCGGPGESYSDVILKLVELEAKGEL
jgi:hypothetical protein